MKVKILAVLMSMALLFTGLTACSGTGGQGESGSPDSAETGTGSDKKDGDVITIEFFQQKSEEGPQKGYQAIIDKFNEEYPNIVIEMNTVPDSSKVLVSRIASDDIPVIFSDYPTQMQFKEKVKNGYVEKLSGQDFLNRVNESALEMSKAEDGEIYALPYSNNFMGIYYNTEIFEENNLTVPETYDELITICKTLSDKGIAPLGLTYKDPGRVGHMFQAMNIAWMEDGIEKIGNVCDGSAKLSGDAEYKGFAEKMLELTSYANEDAFGISDTAMWENFANGQYAMCIAGSYARGTLMIANPDLKMGTFPIPNDTKESTNILTGVDAAVCISAKASDEEKDAALKFLEFLSRPENAQVWCDCDGAPSCITEVVYKDEGVAPVLDMIKSGNVHDWMASTIPNNIVTELYSATQGFLMEKDIDQYLSDMDTAIELNAE